MVFCNYLLCSRREGRRFDPARTNGTASRALHLSIWITDLPLPVAQKNYAKPWSKRCGAHSSIKKNWRLACGRVSEPGDAGALFSNRPLNFTFQNYSQTHGLVQSSNLGLWRKITLTNEIVVFKKQNTTLRSAQRPCYYRVRVHFSCSVLSNDNGWDCWDGLGELMQYRGRQQ